MPPSATRLAAGAGLALAIALAAYRARSLDRGGAAAATLVGTLAVAAGWGWGLLLIVYFVSSTLLSRWRRTERAERIGDVVEKGDRRDAAQVLANGGVFALAALGLASSSGAAAVRLAPLYGAAGAGALAAAAADTWATEVGTLVGGTPRSVRDGRPVPPGTSGAVSGAGTLALAAGAAFVALVAAGAGVATWRAAAAGGVAGAVADTLLGAAMQERRWCDRCAMATERRVHGCGASTRMVGGVARIDNDVVNAACTAVGALVALAVAASVARVT